VTARRIAELHVLLTFEIFIVVLAHSGTAAKKQKMVEVERTQLCKVEFSKESVRYEEEKVEKCCNSRNIAGYLARCRQTILNETNFIILTELVISHVVHPQNYPASMC